jgi:hypothetical protein
MAAMDGFRSKQFYINLCTIFFLALSSAEMSMSMRGSLKHVEETMGGYQR